MQVIDMTLINYKHIYSQLQTLKQEKMMLLDDLKVAEEKKQKESSDAAKPGAQNGDIHAKHEVISVEEFKQK